MKRPIDNPKFWAQRLKDTSSNDRHHAVFVCTNAMWEQINERHRVALANHVRPTDKVLDLGCGWGRLLDLLPPHASYTGIDLCPDFIAMARMERPGHQFHCGRFLEVLPPMQDKAYDVGILVSIRGMILRELGEEAWEKNLEQMSRVCRRLLFLEYGLNDPEEIQACP